MPQQTDRALEALCTAVDRAQERLDAVRLRAAYLRAERAKGRSYAEVVEEEERPLVVELLSSVLEELSSAGAAFRRAEARVLHDDGMSQEEIARLFGVTRQRVGVLLQNSQRD
jgi:DNA invertase Pin-like site-specific DNA recombinase